MQRRIILKRRPRSVPARPPRRFRPWYSRLPIGAPPLKEAVQDTRRPFLALAGALGGAGGLASVKFWDTIRIVLDEVAFKDWFRSEAVLLFYIALMSVLGFLLLTLMLMRILDGWWMFSIARNMVVAASLCVVVVLFRFAPEHAFAGFALVGLSAAFLLSYVGSGFPRLYWRLRSYGDLAVELFLLAPFGALLWPVYRTTPQVRCAWEVVGVFMESCWLRFEALLPWQV